MTYKVQADLTAIQQQLAQSPLQVWTTEEIEQLRNLVFQEANSRLPEKNPAQPDATGLVLMLLAARSTRHRSAG